MEGKEKGSGDGEGAEEGGEELGEWFDRPLGQAQDRLTMCDGDDEPSEGDGDGHLGRVARLTRIVYTVSTALVKWMGISVVGHFEFGVAKTPHPNPLSQERHLRNR